MYLIYSCSLLEFTKKLNICKILKPELRCMTGQVVTVKDIIIYIIEWKRLHLKNEKAKAYELYGKFICMNIENIGN